MDGQMRPPGLLAAPSQFLAAPDKADYACVLILIIRDRSNVRRNLVAL